MNESANEETKESNETVINSKAHVLRRNRPGTSAKV